MKTIILRIFSSEVLSAEGNLVRVWSLNKARYWHRTDGPAVIHIDGKQEWWINDRVVEKNENH